MPKQDYILKKHVQAETAEEALALDGKTPVHEVHLLADKPDKQVADAIGFHTVRVEEE